MEPDEEVVEKPSEPAEEAGEPSPEEPKQRVSKRKEKKKKKEDVKAGKKGKGRRDETREGPSKPGPDAEAKPGTDGKTGEAEIRVEDEEDEPVEVKDEAEARRLAEAVRERRARGRFRDDREKEGGWEPKTRLGRMVKNGEIKTMGEALATGYPLREAEIVDILLPEIDDEVLDVNMVQRMTDSGRRVRFAITTVVGNGDGYVGLGKATGKEVGPAIRKAIDNAKLNIIEIKRGCGSWECGCGTPHSLPFQVTGKSGSAEVTFKPAPRGISLAVGDVAKHMLRLAGISDSWGFTEGKTRTTVNYAKAAYDALKKLSEMRIMPEQVERLHIRTGSIGVSTLEKEGEER